MINFFNMVNALRQQTKEDARIHGVITNGGVAPVMPGSSVLGDVSYVCPLEAIKKEFDKINK